MGNCQAIDAATLVIQHPNGKVDNLYWPVPASDIMKMNPGHYVALLITTTTFSHTTTTSATETTTHKSTNKGRTDKTSTTTTTTATSTGRSSLRITRVKLLRPTDMLVLGHVYRLISTQEVIKGLVAKKQAKMRKNGIELADSEALKDADKLASKSLLDKTHRVSRHGHGHGHGHQSRSTAPKEGAARPRTWQPSLNSISESAS